jgi:hypothetical protein
MADRRNYFFGQRVSESELDAGFNTLEQAEFALKVDAFAGTGFLMSACTVAQDAPPSTSVSVGVALGWDKLGERVERPAAGLFAFAGDSDPVNPRIARLYVKFARAESDGRVDDNAIAVNFVRDESFVLERDLGTPAGVPVAPALRTDESILLANITIPAAAGVIGTAQIDATVQNRNSSFPIRRIQSVTDGLSDAFLAAAGASPAPSTANRVAVLSDVAGQVLGFMGQNKIVTTAALSIDIERLDAVDGTGAKFIRLRNEPITLTGGAAAVNNKDYGGPISNTFHYVYALADSTGANPDTAIASLNAGPGFGGGGPTIIPLGYDLFRLIGVFQVVGGAILPFRQINGEALYDDTDFTAAFPFGVDPHVGAAPTGFVTLSLAAFVPVIAERVIIGVREANIGAQNYGLEFRSRGGPALVGKTIAFYDGSSAAAGVGTDYEFRLHVDITQLIDWQRVLGGSQNVEVVVRGFIPDLHYDT